MPGGAEAFQSLLLSRKLAAARENAAARLHEASRLFVEGQHDGSQGQDSRAAADCLLHLLARGVNINALPGLPRRGPCARLSQARTASACRRKRAEVPSWRRPEMETAHVLVGRVALRARLPALGQVVATISDG